MPFELRRIFLRFSLRNVYVKLEKDYVNEHAGGVGGFSLLGPYGLKTRIFTFEFVERFVYLDFDTVIMRPLEVLFDFQSFSLSRTAKAWQVNNGVMVFSPSKNMFRRLIECFATVCEPGISDQDCWGFTLKKFGTLQWNSSAPHYYPENCTYSNSVKELGTSNNQIPWIALPFAYNALYAELHSMLTTVREEKLFVLHFPGHSKPDIFIQNKERSLAHDVWWSYWEQSLQDDSTSAVLKSLSEDSDNCHAWIHSSKFSNTNYHENSNYYACLIAPGHAINNKINLLRHPYSKKFKVTRDRALKSDKMLRLLLPQQTKGILAMKTFHFA